MHGEYFTLLLQAAPRGQCAVVVGKKLSKKATDRNRLRRVVYSILRDTRFWEERSLHCAVLLKPAAEHASRAALEKGLRDLTASML